MAIYFFDPVQDITDLIQQFFKYPCALQSKRVVKVRETTSTLLPFLTLLAPPPHAPLSFKPPLPHRYVMFLSRATWLCAFALCLAKTADPDGKHSFW